MANYDDANPLVRILPCKGDRGVNTGATVVTSASDMTDRSKAYLFAGATSGNYIKGHWYYYNGSAWTDGGSYNLAVVDDELDSGSDNAVRNSVIAEKIAALEAEIPSVDDTLTQEGQAADAKAVGARIDVMKDYIPMNIALNERAAIINDAAVGDVVDLTETTTSYAGIVIENVSEGDVVVRTGACDGNRVRGITFLAADNTVLFTDGSRTYTNKMLIAPPRTARVIINNNNGGDYSISVGKNTIANLGQDIDTLEDISGPWVETGFNWTNNRVGGVSGIISSSLYSLLSDEIKSCGAIKVQPGYKVAVHAWSNGQYLGFWDGTTLKKDAVITFHNFVNVPLLDNYGDLRYRIHVVRDDAYNITAAEAAYVSAHINVRSDSGDSAYSWWVTNRQVGNNGVEYFTYIGKNAMAGVASRYPDGSVYRQDLYQSSSCDDHNAPAVVLIPDGHNQYVCVIGSTGHNASRQIHTYIATVPNTVRCTFENRTQSILAPPSGKFYANSYAQVFVDENNNIYDIFRVKQANSSDGTVEGIVWVCAKSSDFGQTWQIFRLLKITSTLDYIWLADVEGSDTLKRIILQRNTSATPVLPIRAGYVDLVNNNVYDNAMVDLNKPMTAVSAGEPLYTDSVVSAEYDDFTQIIPAATGYRIRLLDVWPTATGNIELLYARTAVQSDQTNFTLYKFKDGESIEIDNLGMPFCETSLYITGACFCGDSDTIVYSKNVSTTKDGVHELRMARLSGGSVSESRVMKKSKQLIARPARFDDGSVMYLAGRYNEKSGAEYTSWALSLGFVDT